MRVAFMGTSHAAQHLSRAAAEKSFQLCTPNDAELVFVSEDTPTDAEGRRDMEPIRSLVRMVSEIGVPLVLTSQVPPGFTRSLGVPIYHQAETLRIRDAAHRALYPEMLIVGCEDPAQPLPLAYAAYLNAFGCPILTMTWEEAEFAKVAINVTLIAQVENTNRLAAAAKSVGARWAVIAQVLQHDSRIGPRSYLEPGRWQDSRHLMRDWKTMTEIL